MTHEGAICQPQCVASQTVPQRDHHADAGAGVEEAGGERPLLLREPHRTALMEAGKLAASAKPSTKRTMMKPEHGGDQAMARRRERPERPARPARAFFTPNRSTKTPMTEGNAAYAKVNAKVIQP